MTPTEQVDMLIEQHNYERARSLAFEQLENGLPSKDLVVAFLTSDDESRLELLRTLSINCPSDIDTLLAYVYQLIRLRRAKLAWLRCSDAIPNHSDPKHVFLLRQARLLASIECGKTEEFEEDIKFLMNCELPGANRMWTGTLRDIVAATNLVLAPLLERLVEIVELDPITRQLFAMKAAEIRMLDSAK